MLNMFKKISLGNWILIGMLLGLIVGLLLNFYVHDPFIKDIILMDNVFYVGGNLFSDLIILVKPETIVYTTSLVLVIVGGLVGMFGSLNAVRRYLKI